MKIYLLRHCATAGQEPDAPLTPQGEEQAERLADFLADKGIDAIATSPYLRARESIAPFARRRGLAVRIDQRLAERVLSVQSLPDWQEALRRTFEDADLSFPGGETSRAATARGLDALHKLEESGCATAAAVTHGNLMALLLRSFDPEFGYAEWRALRNPDCYVIETGEGAPKVWHAW